MSALVVVRSLEPRLVLGVELLLDLPELLELAERLLPEPLPLRLLERRIPVVAHHVVGHEALAGEAGELGRELGDLAVVG